MFERSFVNKDLINITFDFNSIQVQICAIIWQKLVRVGLLPESDDGLQPGVAAPVFWALPDHWRCSTSGQAVPRTHPRSLPNEVTIPSSHLNVQGEAKAAWVLRCRTCWTALGEASLPQTTSNSLSRPCQEQTNSEGNFADSSKQIDLIKQFQNFFL